MNDGSYYLHYNNGIRLNLLSKELIVFIEIL